MEYEDSKQALITDLKSMPQSGGVRFYWGGDYFTPQTLLKEIEDETKVGKEHIEMHIDAMALIAELKVERETKKKRWWRICEKLKSKIREL